MPKLSFQPVSQSSRRQFLANKGSLLLAMMVTCSASLLAASPARSQATGGENWAAKMFSNHSHDFRIVGRGTKCEYHFDFTNLYEEDVHVAAVRSSCGCTTPTVTKDTVKTHQKSAIVAAFNTSTFIGKKSADITVVFDRPFYAEVKLKVSGFIRTDVTFDPPEVAFGEIVPGAGTTQDIVITYTGSKAWQITDVRSHCDDLEVQLSSAQKTPGMVKYRMRVNVKGTMPEGDVRERLTLISNDRNFPTTEMSINGRVRPSLTVSPSAVSIGTASLQSVTTKKLLVRADEPFSIEKVVCADKRFQFDLPTGKKKLHVIPMHFDAGNRAGRIAQELRIETDLKGGKSVSCIVTGSIRG